jgi:hypothetical protein
MTDEEYILTRDAIIMIARLSMAVDVEGLLKRIKHAEAIGPILDPTLFLKASENLEKTKHIAEAVGYVKKMAQGI